MGRFVSRSGAAASCRSVAVGRHRQTGWFWRGPSIARWRAERTIGAVTGLSGSRVWRIRTPCVACRVALPRHRRGERNFRHVTAKVRANAPEMRLALLPVHPHNVRVVRMGWSASVRPFGLPQSVSVGLGRLCAATGRHGGVGGRGA